MIPFLALRKAENLNAFFSITGSVDLRLRHGPQISQSQPCVQMQARSRRAYAVAIDMDKDFIGRYKQQSLIRDDVNSVRLEA